VVIHRLQPTYVRSRTRFGVVEDDRKGKAMIMFGALMRGITESRDGVEDASSLVGGTGGKDRGWAVDGGRSAAGMEDSHPVAGTTY
jgi:malic enzyme